MKTFLQLFILINLIYISLSIVPFWNFEKSTIDLLSNENQKHEYTLTEYTFHFKLKCIYKRYLQKTDGITVKNKLTCYFEDDASHFLPINQEFNFEEVESVYTDKKGKYYICPKGRNHVFSDYKGNGMEQIVPDNFVDKGDWELKCFLQYDEYNPNVGDAWKKLFVFYLNKEDYIYEIALNSGEMTKVGSNKYNIIGFHWTSKGNNNILPMYAIVEKDKKIRIEHFDFNVIANPTEIKEIGYSSNLVDVTKSNFKGFVYDNGANSKFYYISYETNSTDLVSGYSDNLDLLSSDESSKMNINNESPLKFIGNISIENIKFIPFTKYAYYILNDNEKNKKYYGILDIKANKIIYNTDEQLIKYTNYLDNSMLAITSESAYRICTICSNKECVNTCPNTIYYDTEKGNICEESTYKCDKYTLIPDNICITSCDTNIFYDDGNNQCGLCKDFNFGKPFKMVNHTGCLEEIIDKSHYVNDKYGLISCNDNYSFFNNECRLKDCYKNCEICSEKTNNETDQKCLSCKSDFPILYKGNCLENCPTTTYRDEDNTCKECNSMCKTCDKNGCTSCESGYYLNNDTHSCEQCHKKCETCSKGGTDENNNCNICKNPNDKNENGNCITFCRKDQYRSGEKCLSCKANCASCSDGDSCDSCPHNFYLYNERDCRSCHKTCYNCTDKGNETNHNCLSCNNNFFFVIGGIYENNCVETCPKNTVKDDISKICTYVEPGDISDDNNQNSSSSNSFKSKLMVWIFVAVAAVLLIVFNIIFFGNICCCQGKEQDDSINTIQTELSDMNLIIN